jgi:GT2 family glycosyltransferase
MTRIAAVVATLDRADAAQRVVAALQAQSTVPAAIVVVDQSTPPADFGEGVTMVAAAPCGPAAARNLGAAAAGDVDVLLFVEDDGVLDSQHFVANHLRWYAHDFVAAVHGGVRQPGQPLPEEPLTSPGATAVDVLARSPNCQGVRSCIGLAGGNVSIRRGVFEGVGGFDERFGRGEDIELGVRLYRSGAVTIYDPDAALVHERSPSGGTRSTRSPSATDGLFRPEPHPGEYLLHLVHWPGAQAASWRRRQLARIWRPCEWRNPARCLVRTIRLLRSVRAARRLLREPPRR